MTVLSLWAAIHCKVSVDDVWHGCMWTLWLGPVTQTHSGILSSITDIRRDRRDNVFLQSTFSLLVCCIAEVVCVCVSSVLFFLCLYCILLCTHQQKLIPAPPIFTATATVTQRCSRLIELCRPEASMNGVQPACECVCLRVACHPQTWQNDAWWKTRPPGVLYLSSGI